MINEFSLFVNMILYNETDWFCSFNTVLNNIFWFMACFDYENSLKF